MYRFSVIYKSYVKYLLLTLKLYVKNGVNQQKPEFTVKPSNKSLALKFDGKNGKTALKAGKSIYLH